MSALKHLMKLAGAAACILAVPAIACPPPPVPPRLVSESDADYTQRLNDIRDQQKMQLEARLLQMQRDKFDNANQIFIARIYKRGKTKLYPGFYSPKVKLRPEHWIKGSGRSRSFTLQLDGMTSCGSYGGGDAVNLPVGAIVVVFDPPQYESEKNKFGYDNISLDQVRDPRLRELIIPLLSEEERALLPDYERVQS